MGYTTQFEGSFKFNKPLLPEQIKYIQTFSDTRRMKRRTLDCAKFPDPIREAVGLPIGLEGEFFVGATEDYGQKHDSSIVDYNRSPSTQPGLWCDWTVDDYGTELKWNGSEKFYNYTEWLEYMVKNFFHPWGYSLSGRIYFQGEDEDDHGYIDSIDLLETPIKVNDPPALEYKDGDY